MHGHRGRVVTLALALALTSSGGCQLFPAGPAGSLPDQVMDVGRDDLLAAVDGYRGALGTDQTHLALLTWIFQSQFVGALPMKVQYRGGPKEAPRFRVSRRFLL